MNENWADDCKALVGGQSPLIDKTIDLISNMIKYQDERHAKGLSNVLGILFEGLSGVGKLHLATSLAETSGLPLKVVKLEDFFKSSASGIAGKILDAFSDDNLQVMVVENVDLVVGRLVKDSGDFERTILEVFDLVFERLSKSTKAQIIIGTTSALDRIGTSWLCGTRFSSVQRVTVSKPEQRREILQILLKGMLNDEMVGDLASCTHGYTVADLRGLISEAICNSSEVSLDDFLRAKQVVRPSMMAEYFSPLPTASMDDLVGIDAIKEHLRELIITPIREPTLAEKYKLGLPKGILIHGPTGSGKTHLAQGLVREAGLNYIPVIATSIRSKYVGQSEKNLAALFKQARDCAPSILLIDQIDALVSKRGASSTSDNSGNRLVTCFLTEIDGLAAKGSDSSVLVIGITDSIEKMDDAMIRPGRLGVHIQMPLDLDGEGRRLFFTKCKISMSLSEAEIETIVSRTDGYNGARMDWLVREAAMSALDEGSVTFAHICKVLDKQ